MLFNSFEFAIFLPIVFFIYWFITSKNLKLQNSFVVIASYVFYGFWDWRFLSLIIFSSLVDYLVGIGLSANSEKKKRKLLLFISIVINIGFLGFFKYYNFFAESFANSFTLFGTSIEVNRLNIVLPVGISFYTFQTLSYTIDVYKNKLKPTKDIISFFAFVSFFPQLVAGPIERASNLLPQFYKKRNFNYASAVDGMRQLLWGLFKKIVVADNCAEFANQIFNNSTEMNGSTLVLGAFLFSFQIYGDFSGYSDIAIGTSRLFGFNLRKNFAFPYFSRDIAEFWRRWHISLSTWFRDYLYIPLGGSRGGMLMKVRNIFIIFIVSGFWHGANWTFIFWGGLNAIYFLPLLLTKKNRKNLDTVATNKWLPSLKEFFSIFITFCLTMIAWIFFRAENLDHAFSYISEIFSESLFQNLIPKSLSFRRLLQTLIIIVLFQIVEWMGRRGSYGIENIKYINSSIARAAVYIVIALLILILGNFNKTEFIYFAF